MRYMKGIVVCLASILYGVVCIDLLNGRYSNVNIVIQNTVKEDDVLIERIKGIFTKASQFLFEATRHQVYFGNIKIIIPKSWSEKSEYEKIPVLPEMDTYITVDEGNVTAPHVKRKDMKCGSPGRYMYLPASFVLQKGKTDFGYHENVVVHEWGHLRWGLWDEYGMKGENRTNGRFYLDAGEWKPVRCSESVKGEVGEGWQCTPAPLKCKTTKKEIDDSCEFCPYSQQSITNMSSLMAYNWLDAVAAFCDNDTNVPIHQIHNRKGPSKQNDMCGSRSSWEVMRDHGDFKSEETLPESKITTPTFRIMQETVGYQVLVLDVSGSMNSSSRLTKMSQASAYMIKTKIPEYNWLGIVWFTTTAFVMKNLSQINDGVKDEFLSALPKEALNNTCIGCGIDEALKILRTKLGDPAGSEIIVISDGRDNTGYLNESIQNASEAGVTIHSISISQNADPRMINMANATGGKHFSYLEVGTISITSAFLEILPSAATSFATEFVTLVSEQYNTLPHKGVETTFNIDSDIGKNTSICILQGDITHLRIDVSDPNGLIYTEETTKDNILLDIPDTAIAGQYNITITTNASTVEFYVTSLPTNTEAVRVFSWISPIDFDFSSGELPVIVADVMKGRAAVLNVTVTAVVETTFANNCTVSLFDNGADPDDTFDDGVYAGVIPAFCIGRNGRVSAKIYVHGESGKTYVQDVYSGARSPKSGKGEIVFEVIQEYFQRTVVTNEILVKSYTVDDVTAPGRIKDVSIIDISTEHTQYGESRNFTITWTATGDDINIGQALEYELRISSDKNVLVNDFTSAELLSISNTNFTPKASGVAEYIRIEIDAKESYTSTKYLAVRAKDEKDNVGAVSNIISILVANGYRMSVKGDVIYSYSKKDEEAKEETVKEKKNKSKFLIILLPCIMFVIIIIMIFVAIIAVKKGKVRETVGVSEYGSNAPTTTVSKKVFQSIQLGFNPERERNCNSPLDSKSLSTIIQDRRKSHDVTSQSSCTIEMCYEKNVAVNGNISENDDKSLLSKLLHKGSRVDMVTNEDEVEVDSDIMPGEVNVEIKTPRTHERFVNERSSVSSKLSLDCPVLNPKSTSNGESNIHEEVCL